MDLKLATYIQRKTYCIVSPSKSRSGPQGYSYTKRTQPFTNKKKEENDVNGKTRCTVSILNRNIIFKYYTFGQVGQKDSYEGRGEGKKRFL